MDIAPWLHGVDTDSSTVQVAWRADVAADNVDRWPEIIEAAPPVVGELMPCPVGAVRRWLGNRVALANGRLVTRRDVRPGDTLVVPCTYGGYDRWGWSPRSRDAVRDIGNVVERRLTRIRLHPALYPDHAGEIAALTMGTAKIKDVLSAIGIDVPRPVVTAYPEGVLVTNANPRVNGKEVRLADHLPGVGGVAERITPKVLDETVRKTVIAAARQHDIGKADPRFQAMLGAKDELLAKSAHRSPTEALQARYWSGLPLGWRHEVASVAKLPTTASDLLRYLVGTHHGFARAILPIGGDPDLWHQAGGQNWSGMTHSLNAAYGPWALAYLESLVRLSDWIRTREELERA
jgi:CRISPR-associated endonuclease/helicase Cas3